MRFRGTLALLVVCVAVGAFVYFYEIKGGEKREKAQEEEKRLWKVESDSIQQIDLITPDEHITGVRTGEKAWKLTAPRALDADADELNRIATSAADLNRESVVVADAADLGAFGLEPAQLSLQIKIKDGTEHKVRFGNNNPTGNSTYGVLEGEKEVFMVASYVAGNFKKKLEDLRNHSILGFDQNEAQTLDLQSSKGSLELVKENDKWWIQGRTKWPADSSSVSTLLSSVATGRLKEFFEGSPDDYVTLGFDKPVADLRVTVGKDKAIKHLVVGMQKSQLRQKKPAPAEKKSESAGETILYVARDESRSELFYVDKEFVDKLLKTPADLRDKTLASFQRWDIDGVRLTNSQGTFTFAKSDEGGDWLLGEDKKKTKWDAVNGILDALEKPVKNFVDAPGAPAVYGLDRPSVRVVLSQKGAVKVDCAFGKETGEGIYAQVQGESFVKIADKDGLEKLAKGETDFVEAPPPPEPGADKDSSEEKK